VIGRKRYKNVSDMNDTATSHPCRRNFGEVYVVLLVHCKVNAAARVSTPVEFDHANPAWRSE